MSAIEISPISAFLRKPTNSNTILIGMSQTLTQPLQVRGWQFIAGTIDHTLLKPEANRDQIIRLCEEAAHFGFATVCVNPWWVGLAASALSGSTRGAVMRGNFGNGISACERRFTCACALSRACEGFVSIRW